MYSIFIEGNVPSSKNSQIKTSSGIFKSKAVRHYLQEVGVKNYSSSKRVYENYKTRPNKIEFIKSAFLAMIKDRGYPLRLGIYFVRDSKRRFDFINCFQIIADLLVAHSLIPDDSAEYLAPVFIGYCVDKERPGIYLTLEDDLCSIISAYDKEFR